jgi:hypothetical protein
MWKAAVLVMLVLPGMPAAGQEVPVGGASGGDDATAYLDASARGLVREARSRRRMVDTRIDRYETTARERISVGLSAGLGERLLYRRETASHIDWTRDTVRIEVLGAREVVPSVRAAAQVPRDLAGYVPALAFDPVDSEMLLRFDTTVIRHPLSAGSEAHYRFASGDTTVIRLPDGRAVTIRELRFTPRRRDPQLIAGSFWLDASTHAVVQAYFRLARAFDSRRDSREGRSSILLPAVRGELEYVAIDYGLWDLHWWLPRTVSARGMVQVGPLRMPMSFERRYDGYAVTGDTSGVPADTTRVLAARPCRPRTRLTVAVSAGPAAPADTVRAPRTEPSRREEGQRATRRRADAMAGGEVPADSATVCDREFIVSRAGDADLLGSPLLPPDIYGGEAVIGEAELRGIAEMVRRLPGPSWQIERPVVEVGLRGPGLVRYNRVEGLSVGGRAQIDLGAAVADAMIRVGTAAGEIGAEAGVSRPGGRVDARLAGYRRLDAVDVAAGPFTLGSSLGALLLGRDDNDYFRATGAELVLRPPRVQRQWYELRLFAETQRAVATETEFSLPGLFDGDRTFRDNIEADRAGQVGAVLRIQGFRGYDPGAVRGAAELTLHGETGDYRFFRPSLQVRAGAPLSRRLALGVEAGGGTSFGDVPAQRVWQLGGGSTLRGYAGGAMRGEAFWRGRGELGLGLPVARLALFGDAGWAGPRDDALQGRPSRSLGAGVSVLDGLLRVDVARAVDAPRGWRLHFRFDGAL